MYDLMLNQGREDKASCSPSLSPHLLNVPIPRLPMMRRSTAHCLVKSTRESDTPAARPGMDMAACYGHLCVIEWLNENRQEGCTERAMNPTPLQLDPGSNRNAHQGGRRNAHRSGQWPSEARNGCRAGSAVLGGEDGSDEVTPYPNPYPTP